jgi:hypothetical protein
MNLQSLITRTCRRIASPTDDGSLSDPHRGIMEDVQGSAVSTHEDVKRECLNLTSPSGWIGPALDSGSGCSRLATVQLVDYVN